MAVVAGFGVVAGFAAGRRRRHRRGAGARRRGQAAGRRQGVDAGRERPAGDRVRGEPDADGDEQAGEREGEAWSGA